MPGDMIHIMMCTNNKKKGKCCGMSGADELFEYIKGELNRKRPLFKSEKHVKVVRTSCLGRCGYGPNIMIVPDNVWYSIKTKEDADLLIRTRLIEEKIPHSLMNKKLHEGENHDVTHTQVCL